MLKNQSLWILFAGLLGYIAASTMGDSTLINAADKPVVYELIALAKQIFLSLLKMLVAPIVFFSLIGGIISLNDGARLKQLGSATVIYYLATTAIAIGIGLVVVFFIHPWEGTASQISVDSLRDSGSALDTNRMIDLQSTSLIAVVSNILRLAFQNPFSALANLNIIGIATNALILGIALVLVAPKNDALRNGVETINKALAKILSFALWTAPFGVFAILFEMTLKTDGALVNSLIGFCLVVFAATMVHGLIILPTIAWLLGGMPITSFFRKASRPLLVALSTSSSAATLPVSIDTAKRDMKVDPSVSNFVLPFGATMNMDGTALFEGVAAVFLAYLFGIDLSTTATIAIFLMAMLSSIGAPGMPSGSMAAMQMVLLAAGIPLEGIGILLAVERLLDTFRTAVNVEGDLVGSLVVNRIFTK